MVPEVESRIIQTLLVITLAISIAACNNDKEPTAPAIHNRNSLPIMSTSGVSKLISDSGIIRYKLISERWDVYDKTKPQRQDFLEGIFMEKFDEHFKIEMYITADTAYWYDQNLWELRGRVEVRKKDGTVFNATELYWNMGKHIVYSDKYVRIVTPTQELRGTGFRSDEELTDYEVKNSAGSFPVPEEKKQEDSVKREPEVPDINATPNTQKSSTTNANAGNTQKKPDNGKTEQAAAKGAQKPQLKHK